MTICATTSRQYLLLRRDLHALYAAFVTTRAPDVPRVVGGLGIEATAGGPNIVSRVVVLSEVAGSNACDLLALRAGDVTQGGRIWQNLTGSWVFDNVADASKNYRLDLFKICWAHPHAARSGRSIRQ